MADTDPVTAELDQIRQFLDGGNAGEWYAAGRMLLAAVDKVLALHVRPEKPVRCWDLDLACEKHQWLRGLEPHMLEETRKHALSVRNCPDCRYRERYFCTHCDHEEWPCPTYSAVLAGLKGEKADG